MEKEKEKKLVEKRYYRVEFNQTETGLYQASLYPPSKEDDEFRLTTLYEDEQNYDLEPISPELFTKEFLEEDMEDRYIVRIETNNKEETKVKFLEKCLNLIHRGPLQTNFEEIRKDIGYAMNF